MSLELSLKNLEFNFKVVERGENRIFEFGEFRLDAATKLLYRSGEPVTLTPKAVETLIALAESPGKVIGKDELMDRIWPGTIVEESNLAQYLHVLRKTLGDTSDGKPFIETLKRRGYRFNGTVSVLKNAEKVANQKEDPQTSENISNIQSKTSFSPARRVERRGNVLAVADWRLEEPVPDTSPPVVRPAQPRSFSPLTAAVLVAVFAIAAFGIYRFSFGGRSGVVKSGVPFRESEISRLTTSGKSKRASISPDGRYVAHVLSGADGDSLWVRQVAVANDTRIAGPSTSDFAWVTFAPDGNFVYYLTLEKNKGEPELFRVPVMGGLVVKVANNIAPPTFSPDGKQMAFMKTDREETRLLVSDADGANEKVLVTRHEPDHLNMFWFAPAWSLDGKSIVFPAGQGDENGRYETVLAVDVETGIERRLTETRWQQIGQPRWLADGLLVTASESSTAPQQLWHISLPDGTASRVTHDLNNYGNLSLTSDAKTLAVIQDQTVSNIWTLGGDASAPKQIQSEAGRFNEIIWLPDGRLAYTSNAGGVSDIWTMNADGSNIRQLTMGANARLGLAVTADEKQLVFAAERDGKYNLWRVDIDGANLTRITNGDGEYYPQCTPDGRWIVYQSGANYPTIWKMPIGGGDPVPITKTKGSRPSLSPDGRFVAYHYLDSDLDKRSWSIGVSSVADGERIKRFDFPSTVVERLVKWTRDGKSIAFLNSPRGVPNIWLQPLDGEDPTPLTDFPSDNIISFNWNPDGSQLAVIRGVETSDVVLINRSNSK